MSYEGSIYIDKDESKQMKKVVRAKKIAYLPQYKQVPKMRVIDLITHGRHPHLSFSKIMRVSDHKMVERAAAMANVSHLLQRYVDTLSGGERQRVYIAMMIAQDADILLLDEPTTFLDIEHQMEVFTLLSKLHEQKKGIVVVVHDLAQAFSYAKKIVLLEKGHIVLQGSPQDVYTDACIYEQFKVRLQKQEDKDVLYPYQLRK